MKIVLRITLILTFVMALFAWHPLVWAGVKILQTDKSGKAKIKEIKPQPKQRGSGAQPKQSDSGAQLKQRGSGAQLKQRGSGALLKLFHKDPLPVKTGA